MNIMKKQTFNPYLPSYEYIPDGEPYVFDGRLYVYGSHDHFGGTRYCGDDYVLWSADINDPSDWFCHGRIYHRDQDPMHHINNNALHAPDITIGTDGRYYLYYPHLYYVGVAVSDNPHGPFEFYGRVSYTCGTPYGASKGNSIRPISADDPAVLLDTDGRVWLYTGYVPSNPQTRTEFEKIGKRYEGAFCIELADDMKTVKGEPKLIAPGKGFGGGTSFEGNEFFEASGIRKIGNTYYFVYSSHRSHDLCYATSKYPDRNFVYQGILVSCIDGGLSDAPTAIPCNTHGNLVNIGDQWYIFYHRASGSKFSRQGCAEKIELLQDGSFVQSEITSCGLNNSPLVANGRYSAHIACNLSGIDCNPLPFFTQDGKDGSDCPQYISGIRNGNIIGYKYFDFPQKPITLTVTHRGNACGLLEISIGSGEPTIAAIKIMPCDNWHSESVSVAFTEGKHALFFRYLGEGSMDLSSFEFN